MASVQRGPAVLTVRPVAVTNVRTVLWLAIAAQARNTVLPIATVGAVITLLLCVRTTAEDGDFLENSAPFDLNSTSVVVRVEIGGVLSNLFLGRGFDYRS